jgi:tetratricopeptide (TPR) repeat protein
MQILNSVKTDTEIHVWPKSIREYKDPAKRLTTKTPFNEHELDGYSGLCKHVFWTDVKERGIALHPEGSAILEDMPEPPKIPEYEGYELYKISTRDLLKALAEKNDHLLAKAILRAISSEPVLAKGTKTTYRDAANLFISGIKRDPQAYTKSLQEVKKVPQPKGILAFLRRLDFTKNKIYTAEDRLADYIELVKEALRIKLGKQDELTIFDEIVPEFFTFIQNRTMQPYLKQWLMADRSFPGAHYFSRTAPTIVQLLSDGFKNKKIGRDFVGLYEREIKLVLEANFNKTFALFPLKPSFVDREFQHRYAKDLASKAGDHLLAEGIEAAAELTVRDFPKESVEGAKGLLKVLLEGKEPDFLEKAWLGDLEGALKSTEKEPAIITSVPKACIFLALGRYEEAKKQIDYAIFIAKQDPDWADFFPPAFGHGMLGAIAVKQDDMKESLRQFDMAIKYNRKYTDAYAGKAGVLYKTGRYLDVISTIDELRRAIFPHEHLTYQLWRLRARAAEKLGDPLEHSLSLMMLARAYPQFHVKTLTDLESRKQMCLDGHVPGAIYYEAGILALRPTTKEEHHSIAKTLTRQIEPSSAKLAEQIIYFALDQDAGNPDYWQLYGDIQTAQGRYSRGRQMYEVAEAIRKGAPITITANFGGEKRVVYDSPGKKDG